MRYHTYLCSCCRTLPNGSKDFTGDFEPSAGFKFDPSYEKELTSIARAKSKSRWCMHLCFCNVFPGFCFYSPTARVHSLRASPSLSAVYQYLF